MTDYADLYPYVLGDVPQCSEPLALQHIRMAVHRFCTETRLLKQEHAAIPTVADQATYTMTVPANRRILQLQPDMKFTEDAGDGHIRYLTQTTEKKLDLAGETDYNEFRYFRYTLTKIPGYDPGGWRTDKDTIPTHFFQPTSTTVRLFPIPEQAGNNLYPHMVLAPSLGATEVDGDIIDDYFTTLVSGALSTLLSIPKKPWTDIRGASRKEMDFRDQIQDAINNEQSSRARDDHTVGRTTAYP